ncbi:MAG: hypothetical protein DWQ10_16045, partial [Calditrichaeota bacterium]
MVKERINAMQTSLFSNADELFEQGLQSLAQFQFNDCIETLQEAKSIDPSINNADYFCKIAEFCKNAGLDERSISLDIAEIWRELKLKMHELGGVSGDLKETFYYFARRLRHLDEFDKLGLIPWSDYFLHESACVIHLKKYQDAYSILLDTIEIFGVKLPARYWGYLGDAAFALQKFGKADTAYTILLALNPFDIDWATLQNSKLRTIFSEIAEEETIEFAYAKLPYFAWREEAIHIPPGNKLIAEILQKYDDYSEQFDDFDTATKAHIFAVYVYAEQSREKTEINLGMREKMQALSAELFADYLQVIKS